MIERNRYEEAFSALSTPWFRLPDGRISIQTEDANLSLNELVAMGIDLSGIVVMPQTLEDLFLKTVREAAEHPGQRYVPPGDDNKSVAAAEEPIEG